MLILAARQIKFSRREDGGRKFFARNIKELGKQLFFLNLAQCRLSKNEVSDLENVMHRTKK